MHFIQKEIKKAEESGNETDPEIKKKIETFKRDLERLEKWFPSSGLKRNLKTIFSN